MEKCPNCKSEIKETFVKTNLYISELKIDFINDYSDDKKEKYCKSCYKVLFNAAHKKFINETSELRKTVKELLPLIPIITINNPQGWDYTVKGLVTSQASMGTGYVTDFLSGITDFLGVRSFMHNRKALKGEEFCKNQLRLKAHEMGGNAVIAANLNYNEIGGSNSLLLVTAFGTSIDLKNTNALGEEFSEKMKKLSLAVKRLNFLNQFENIDTI